MRRQAEPEIKSQSRCCLRMGPMFTARTKMETHRFTLQRTTVDREKIKLLLAHGADIHGKDNRGRTALHLAAGEGRQQTVDLLLAHGTDIHCKDKGGDTPLHKAASEYHRGTIELLLAHGAEPCKNNLGFEPRGFCGFKMDELNKLFETRNHYWSWRAPLAFGPSAEAVLLTTLLCAKHRGLRLPVELWQHIFSHLQRRDFVGSAGRFGA
eukprot:m.154404 g.154404  ORF g.154404 m.154404 type:complete len:210 (+) comp10190_c0_seq3:658-1287(+)